MLLQAVVLDTDLTAAQVLARLARLGFWADPQHPQARPWIEASAARLHLTAAEAATRLQRSSWRHGAALRRQWNAQILWYARPLDYVLHECLGAPPDARLLDVLNLHEPDSEPPVELPADGSTPQASGVVFTDGTPLFVSLPMAMAAPPGASPVPTGAAPPAPAMPAAAPSRGPRRGSGARPAAAPAPARIVRAWPRLDAPAYVPARQPFSVQAGLAEEQQAGVVSVEVSIAVPAGQTQVEVTLELTADGVDAPAGWRRTLIVLADDPTRHSVSFDLVGRDPAGSDPYHLTMIELRYVIGGTVCGTAARPLVIGRHDLRQAPNVMPPGTPWAMQPATASPVVLQPDSDAPDLTIELLKPDGNAASGRFVCRLYSPAPLQAGEGPFDIDLGQDARSFAESVVQQIRSFSSDPIVENLLDSHGRAVADQLPPQVFDALHEVAARVAPRAPAVLLVSADPYVPWEIARLDPPLDATRPPFLAAQTVLGRWLRSPRPAAAQRPGAAPARPASQPPASITVKHMAVMAGLYASTSGLRDLPEAKAEAQALVTAYDAIALAANTADLKRLLDAQLTHQFQSIGAADAVHFAGHGDVDPDQSDGAMMMLSDGKPLPSILFRGAKFGAHQQPLIFLNACLIGMGGQLLGDAGGFPGNCLGGGFGAMLGALWEVDDAVAHQIALEFWRRALPTDQRAPEPVAEILRDLRARYHADASQPPIATYLAYVFYGHPRLTLRRQR